MVGYFIQTVYEFLVHVFRQVFYCLSALLGAKSIATSRKPSAEAASEALFPNLSSREQSILTRIWMKTTTITITITTYQDIK